MKIAKVAAKNLLAIAKVYAKATGATLPTVSRNIYGKAGFLDDLKAGRRSVTLTNLDVLLEKFASAWPDGVEWPETAPLSMGPPGKKVPVEAAAGL